LLGVSSSTGSTARVLLRSRRASVAAAATALPARSAVAAVVVRRRRLFVMDVVTGQGVSTALRTSPRCWASTASLIWASGIVVISLSNGNLP